MSLPKVSNQLLSEIARQAGLDPNHVESMTVDFSKSPIIKFVVLAVNDRGAFFLEDDEIKKLEVNADVCRCGK